MASSQSTITIGGYIIGKSMTPRVDNLLTITFGNGGGIVKTGSYDQIIHGQSYGNNSLPYGWYGSIKPAHPGFIFTPPDTTIAFPLVKNIIDINFNVLDTMKPNIYFRKIPKTILINTQDSVQTTVYDNCLFVRKYEYLISYNKGNSWTFIDSVVATFNRSLPSLSANDTSTPNNWKSQTFTPTTTSDSCQIKVTVYDLDGNFTTIISSTFNVVNPVTVVVKNMKKGCIPQIHLTQNFYDVSGRSVQNKERMKIRNITLLK